MLYPKTKRRIQIILGICLICIGILTALLLIQGEYNNCASRWRNNEDAFGLKYASEWDCFWTRADVAVIFFCNIGLIPVGIGVYLCLRR